MPTADSRHTTFNMDDTPANPREDIEAWKEVHRQLTLAVALTKDAINAEKAKRRYLLEEIYLNVGTDGKLLPTSKWGAKVAPKKTKKKVQSDEGVAPTPKAKKKATKKPAAGEKSATSSVPTKKRLKITIRTPAKSFLKQEQDQEQQLATPSPALFQAEAKAQKEQVLQYPLLAQQQQQQPMYSPQADEAEFSTGTPPDSFYNFNSPLHATASAVAVAAQVASQFVASSSFSSPPSAPVAPSSDPNIYSAGTSDSLFQEMLQQQGQDEDEEDLF